MIFHAEAKFQLIETVTEPHFRTFVCYKRPMEITSSLDTLSLPDTLPTRPKHWSAKEWENCFVIGDARYHMFVRGKIEEGPLRDCPDGFVVKVANGKDGNNKIFYEDVSDDMKKLWLGLYPTFLQEVQAIGNRMPAGTH